MVEKWAYFFREADNLTVVPEVLAEHPFIDALDAARTAAFTASEWDAYILAGIAIQNERGALSVAEKRGLQQGEQRGLQEAVAALCDVLGIELTDERQRELTKLDAAELRSLLARPSRAEELDLSVHRGCRAACAAQHDGAEKAFALSGRRFLVRAAGLEPARG
jgi:hypothetical protein